MNVAWKNLSVTASNGRVLLNGISGYAHYGEVTAIMGPSGSGKSTLLDCLAGRLARNATREGNVYVNGQLQSSVRHGIAAYVKQEDAGLLGTLTVYETVSYSASLRLPDTLSWSEKKEAVENAIAQMGLEECKNTTIGNWHTRGLGGGEKRRLSIALEILTQPSLLFLDEPTSGLDSAAAYFVVKTITNLARGSSMRTIIASVHQPGSEVFEQFDNLCLLSHGNLVYFGELAAAGEMFSSAGFPCPSKRNPSDHYLKTINSDFDIVQSRFKDEENGNDMLLPTKEVVKVLTAAFEKQFLPALLAKIEASVTDMYKQETGVNNLVRVNVVRQVVTLTGRSFKNMTRDLGYYWLRIIVYLFLSVVIGSIYFDVGTSYLSIAARVSCISFVGSFLTFMSIGGFPSFVEDIKVFFHEKQNGHYGVLVFTIANTLSSIPYLLLISLGFTAIFYNMVKMHPGFDHFAYFVLNLTAAVVVVESLMMCIAAIVPNFLMGIIVGAGVMGLFMLVNGFFRLANGLFWKYPLHYMSFHTYLLQGLYQNDFEGLEFEGIGSTTMISGRTLLDQYQVDISRSKWTNFGILLAMIVIYRVLFMLMVKLAPWFEKIKELALLKYQ